MYSFGTYVVGGGPARLDFYFGIIRRFLGRGLG